MFMPAEDRYAYAEGLSRGGFLVSLNTTVDNRDRILDILDDEGTIDMDAREESWRAEGWQGYQAGAPLTQVGTTRGIDASGTSLRDRRDDAERGQDRRRRGEAARRQARHRTGTGARPLLRRRDPGRGGGSICAKRRCGSSARPSTGRSRRRRSAFVDRTIEATETSEQAVVSKEARVTEEISLEKAVDTRTETVRDTVRHTEVEVEDERLDRDK